MGPPPHPGRMAPWAPTSSPIAARALMEDADATPRCRQTGYPQHTVFGTAQWQTLQVLTARFCHPADCFVPDRVRPSFSMAKVRRKGRILELMRLHTLVHLLHSTAATSVCSRRTGEFRYRSRELSIPCERNRGSGNSLLLEIFCFLGKLPLLCQQHLMSSNAPHTLDSRENRFFPLLPCPVLAPVPLRLDGGLGRGSYRPLFPL